MKKRAKANDEEMPHVNFRVAANVHQMLAAQAEEHGEESPSIYARTLVERALSGRIEEELRAELERVSSEVRRSREDIATLALLLLVKVCKEDPQKARAWIREHLESS